MRFVCTLVMFCGFACTEDAIAPPPVGDSGSDARTRIDSSRPDTGFDAAVCEPQCTDRACGEDGCGGTCGTCEGFCTTAGACAVSAMCPPAGPFGTEPGEVAADAVLFDCDGNEVRLHELCSADVSWIFEFADWCPPCRAFARDDVQQVWETYSAMGAAGYFVISANNSYETPTAELCAEIRDRYSLTMPVLFDPAGVLQTSLGISSNAWNIVLTDGMVIRWKGKYSEAMVADQIADALAE